MEKEMLSNTEIEEYKRTLDSYNKAVASENAMQEQLTLIKKQAQEKMVDYIEKVNAKKAEKDRILLG